MIELQENEYEFESSPGKYPKTAFSGIFHGYEITENKNKTKVLRLLFDEDTICEIYGRGKLDNGKAPGKLGEYIDSLKALNIKSYATQEDNELLSLRHEPDITDGNYKMSIEPITDKKVGDDQQTQESNWWGRVTKIEKIKGAASQQTAAAKPGKLPKSPKSKEPETPTAELNNDLIGALIEPKLISELKTKFGAKYRVSELSAGLKKLMDEGTVTEDNGKWQVT